MNPVGTATSGVLQIDRIPGITAEARQILGSGSAAARGQPHVIVVDFVKVSTPMAIASPVAEGSIKPENSMTFTTVSEKVRLLATWIPATRQVLDDFTELLAFIRVDLALLRQFGRGTAIAGRRLYRRKFAWLVEPGDLLQLWLCCRPRRLAGQQIDIIAAAIAQIAAAKEIPPDLVMLNSSDWLKIRVNQRTEGGISWAIRRSLIRPSIFGLDVGPNHIIAQGTFLVGSGTGRRRN